MARSEGLKYESYFFGYRGVLQPEHPVIRFTDFDVEDILMQTPFGVKRSQLIEEIIMRNGIESKSSLDCLHNCLAQIDSGYKPLDKYDIAAVCCDWNKEAVKLLNELCKNTGSKIIISSNWRYSKTLKQLKLLFRIHELDNFVIDTTALVFGDHPSQVKEYIITHSNIKQFVIFDDCFRTEFEQMFSSEFIYHAHCFNAELYHRAEPLLLK